MLVEYCTILHIVCWTFTQYVGFILCKQKYFLGYVVYLDSMNCKLIERVLRLCSVAGFAEPADVEH